MKSRSARVTSLLGWRALVVLASACSWGCQATTIPVQGDAAEPNIVIVNDFNTVNRGEGWHIYHYNGGIEYDQRPAGLGSYKDLFPVSWERVRRRRQLRLYLGR